MIYVGEIADIPVGESVRVQGSVAAIAVFNVDGELFAIDDTCTHQDASLADGWLEGCEVECPLHASRFDLRTGGVRAPVRGPDEHLRRGHGDRLGQRRHDRHHPHAPDPT